MPTSTISTKLVIQVAAILLVTIVVLIVSYIYANQPTCPQCKNPNNVLYTWKTFKDSATTTHEFNRLGPVGYCFHYQPPVALEQPSGHFGWFCIQCNKHILRPPNWRSAKANE